MARHLITSAIPYVNGVKHLGNLVGSMLPADVYARFRRAQGHETLFICGTDDHGTPVEIAAQKEGVPVAAFVKKWHDFQAAIYDKFALSFDNFGTSSCVQNHELTQHFAKKLFENNLIDVRTQTMLYSKADGRFLPDRYVEGTCPKCGFGKARGDQCDGCGSVLDPTDLIDPYSSISGSKDLELRDSKHLYLKQSDLVPQLRAWVDSHSAWPVLTKSIAYKWLDEGLEDRGITRDIAWGVAVPPEVFGTDFAGKVFYVWFDAPIAYIAATKEWADKQGLPDSAWQRWWREDLGADDVTYTEFMGKDNVYFHTLSFPATLLGSGEAWKKVDTLKSFNWLTYYGGKFSTSMGVGIFTDQAMELEPFASLANGADYWRYYLLARAPESDDSAFMWADFQAVVNKDLADVLGNFVNRSLQLTQKNFGAVLPPQGELTADDDAFLTRLQGVVNRMTGHMEEMDIRKSVEALREAWVLGNEYLAQQEPWKVVKTDGTRAGTILNVALRLIPLYATLAEPFIPLTATMLRGVLGGQPHGWPTVDRATLLPVVVDGTAFTVPPVLFKKIEDTDVAAWEARFGNKKA